MHSTQIVYFASAFLLLLALLFVNKCCIAKDHKKVFPKLINIIIIVVSLIPIVNTALVIVSILCSIVFADNWPIELKKGTNFYNKWLSRN